jgi:hypothetical protein
MPINITYGSQRQTGLNIPYKYQRPYKRPSRGIGVFQAVQQRMQRQQENYYDLKYRDALLRQRHTEFFAISPEMADPLDEAYGTPEAIQIRAKQKANERAARMGKRIPHPEAQATMTPGLTRVDQRRAEDRAQELADERRDRQQEIEDQDEQFRRSRLDEYIPAVPKHLVGTEWEARLRQVNEAEVELRSPRNFDQTSRETKRELRKIRAERERILNQAGPAPDPAEELNRRTRVWDPGLGQFVQPAAGERPEFILDDNGMPQPFPMSPQEETKAGEAETQKTDRQKRLEDLEDYRRDLIDKALAAEYEGDNPNTKLAAEYKRMAQAVASQIAEINKSSAVGGIDPSRLPMPSSMLGGGANPDIPRPIDTPGSGSAVPTTPTGSGSAGDAGTISPSGKYRHDGTKWVPIKGA